MDSTIISEPNNYVAIICKAHDNENNTFVINPTEVALGKLDEMGFFVSENGEFLVPSVEDFDLLQDNEVEEYYSYLTTIEELQEEYPDVKDINLLMLKYFKDVASKLTIALKTDSEIRVYETSYKAISPEIGGDVSKKIAEDADIIEETKSPIFIPKKEIVVGRKNLINNIEMEEYLKERIFENDDIIEDICTTIAMNMVAEDPRDIEALLSVGPTGSGKTETYKLIAEYLGIPITIYDCNSLTAAGYVGKSIEDPLKMVFANAKNDPEVAKRSILVFDEIDKIADKGSTVGDIEVQNSLLKVLDGHVFDFEIGSGMSSKSINFDTSFLTIVGLGAFPGLFEAKKPKNPFGLVKDTVEEETQEITTEDFVRFGMLAELMGRFHNIYFYKELDKDALKRILIQSKNSPLLRKVQRLKKEFDTDLSWDEEFIDAIVEYAFMKKTGGRSLNKVISNVFKKVDRELLSERLKGTEKSHKLVLTRETITNNKKFKM